MRYAVHLNIITEIFGKDSNLFLPCDAMHKYSFCCRPVFVHLSICLTRWCIVSYGWRYRQTFFSAW